MSPFGALRRNRGSRKPLAYKSILNPGGTLGCTPAGRSTTCARLIARAFELGGGKSCTVILRMMPGASLVQSPIAALPVRMAPLSAAAQIITTMTKTAAKKIARKFDRSLDKPSSQWNRPSLKHRADFSRLPRKCVSQQPRSACVFQDCDD